jgi:hypothetical protein
MKFIPILFSTEMVQAILADRKTQTRRVLKLSRWLPSRTEKQPEVMTVKDLKLYDGNGELQGNLIMKYGKPGDVLWVRESFYEPIFEGLNGKYYYKADLEKQGWDFKWKPSIHMPKEAARLFLRIKDIRVERLQDVSRKDAIAEGSTNILKYDDLERMRGLGNWKIPTPFNEYQFGFLSIWTKINGCESWLSNPWVWVIEFEKIEKPDDF